MKKLIALTIAVFIASAAAGARADEPTKKDKVKAKRLFRQGHRLFKRRKYSQSVEAFKKAYKFWGRREIHFNIAFAYAKLGEKVKAVTHLRKFLKEATPAEKRRVPRILRKMQQSVGVLVIQVPSDEAKIFVDGRDAGSGRVEIVVETGKRVVEIRLKDKTVAKKEFDAEPGMEKLWELTELPRPEPRPDPRPEPRPDPRPGPPPDPTPDPTPKAKPKTGLHWAYFAAAAGLAVVAAGVAAGTGVKTDSLREDYEKTPTRSTMDQGNTMRRTTNAMWGVAAGAAAGAAVLAIFTQWSKPKESNQPPSGGVTVTPGVSPGGVSLHVSF